MITRRPAAYAAELLGTFVLVLFIGLVLASNSKAGLGATDFAVVGLVHAFVLMTLVAAFAGVSGAHFNPAVTVTLTALRKIAPRDAAAYIVLQLVGATLAALVVKVTLTHPAAATNYGATAVNHHFVAGAAGAAVAEAIGTFALMLAIMGAAIDPRATRGWAPLLIGGALGMAVMVIGPVTGAGLNPARAFGPALVSGAFGGAGTFLLVYVTAPIAGALVAGVAYTKVVLEQREAAAPSEPAKVERLAIAD
jgi:MIP family channel proteins